jgi:pterin-4a-carbinolamine dehydratase
MMIATLAKKYNQSTGVVNSLINLLHQFEHLPSVIAEMTEVVVKEYSFQIVPDILR